MQLVPLTTFLCKVASRCNLDCDYCYVYHHVDQSWRHQPHKMSLETAAQLGRRMDEHTLAHELSVIDVIMHGGEPFLVSVPYLRQLCITMREHTPNATIRFHVQTNGTLFDKEALDFCLEWNMGVGLSIDGPRHTNNRHRLDHQGRSSFDAVERALELLASNEGRTLWSGFLAVIDLQNDPLEVYSYLKSFRPPSLDFLLPLCHYDMRPPGKERSLETTPYADWLLQIFEVWYRERPQPVRIRRFRDVIALLAGSKTASEELGALPVDFIVIESDGEIQAVDSLKVTYPGANRLGLNIFDHSFDETLQAPRVIERQLGWSSLCSTCQRCNLVKACGGGYIPHRYSLTNGFQNPSVYCADLTKLIRTIRATVMDDLKRLHCDHISHQSGFVERKEL